VVGTVVGTVAGMGCALMAWVCAAHIEGRPQLSPRARRQDQTKHAEAPGVGVPRGRNASRLLQRLVIGARARQGVGRWGCDGPLTPLRSSPTAARQAAHGELWEFLALEPSCFGFVPRPRLGSLTWAAAGCGVCSGDVVRVASGAVPSRPAEHRASEAMANKPPSPRATARQGLAMRGPLPGRTAAPSAAGAGKPTRVNGAATCVPRETWSMGSHPRRSVPPTDRAVIEVRHGQIAARKTVMHREL
jgi:hypothetical protein